MSTTWYNTRAGKEWRILMQDMTGIFPGPNNEKANSFANSISFCTGISSNAILGWIKNGKIPSMENIQKTIDCFIQRMSYCPVTINFILKETRNFKQQIREQPYVEDKLERLNKYLRQNIGLLDRLVKEYCDAPIVIVAKLTGYDHKSNKYHIHFYDYSKSNTAFMRERISDFRQIKNLVESATVKNAVAGHIKSKNFIINLMKIDNLLLEDFDG